jgi:hypothetical protein
VTGRPTSTKQVFTLQLLRALAAILVILTHSSSAAIHLDFGAIGVDIFFAISGIVMILSTVKLRKQADAAVVFLRRRVVRIVPMYWLFTLLAVIVEVALSRRYGAAVGKHYTAIEVLRSLFFLGKAWPVLIVGWTLNFEAFFYVCFAFFCGFTGHRSTLRPFFLD